MNVPDRNRKDINVFSVDINLATLLPLEALQQLMASVGILEHSMEILF